MPEEDRAIWSMAFYTGLRCGELQALRVCDVDRDAGLIHVRYGWDRKEGRQPTKNRSCRTVPIPRKTLRPVLGWILATGRRDDDLIFGSTAGWPFIPTSLQRRANRVWKAAGLERVTLHDCRHTYASFAIAAGVNAKALSTYMGHATIQITFDRYGHLMPGNEEQAAGLLDSYLAAPVFGEALS